MAAHEGCLYLDGVEGAEAGLLFNVDRANGRYATRPEAPTHAYIFAAKLAQHPDPASIPAGDRLVLIAAYIDERTQGASSLDFARWLDDALALPPPGDLAPAAPEPVRPKTSRKKARDPEDRTPLPGQVDLPLAGPAPAPAPAEVAEVAAPAKAAKARKAKKDRDLSGRWIRYRAGARWVIGQVGAGEGAAELLSFVDEAGETWSGVDRQRVEVLPGPPGAAAAAAAAAEPAPAAEPAAPRPRVVVAIPAKVAQWITKRIAAGYDPESSYADQEVIREFSAARGEYEVRIEFTNGAAATADEPVLAPYLDIYVVGPHKGDPRALICGLPPQSVVGGTYPIQLGDEPAELEVQVDV
jgi:hypothetical protein